MSSDQQFWLEVERVRGGGPEGADKLYVRFKGSLDEALDSPGPWILVSAERPLGKEPMAALHDLDKAQREGLTVLGQLGADPEKGLVCSALRMVSRRSSDR